MRRVNRFSAVCAACLAAIATQAVAGPDARAPSATDRAGAVRIFDVESAAKAALAQTLGTRATVTPNATLYGGFQIMNTTDVYILVRGNSLGTLGVTQAFLDAPRVRIYNSAGTDLVFSTSGQPGFNGCDSASTSGGPVVNYYQNVRGQPAHARDACFAASFTAGTFTFTVTPSIPGVTTSGTQSSPSSGEVLFEITLNP